MKSIKQINLGLVGLGTVGSGVAEIILKHQKMLTRRLGAKLIIKKVSTLNPSQAQEMGFEKSQIAATWQELVQDPKIDIIIEVMGGTTEARRLILEAFKNKKHVVTANKALLANFGDEIFDAARLQNCDICFEAAVGSGIPILRALREGMAANEIESISGIINGTCNYILTKMEERQESFSSILQEAQRLGYAEQEPSFDVDGIDSAHKLAILIAIAYGFFIPLEKIHTEGIREITPFDLNCAKQFGFAIKLLGIAKQNQQTLEARVHPCLVPLQSPLASVREAFNAILLYGDSLGPCLLYGKGAGKLPTASAVVGDVLEISRNILKGVDPTVPPLGFSEASSEIVRLKPLAQWMGEYYLRFSVTDQPGVLAEITGLLGEEGVSIASVYQGLTSPPQHAFNAMSVPVVFLTHQVEEKKIQKALKRIEALKTVCDKTLLIRIERN